MGGGGGGGRGGTPCSAKEWGCSSPSAPLRRGGCSFKKDSSHPRIIGPRINAARVCCAKISRGYYSIRYTGIFFESSGGGGGGGGGCPLLCERVGVLEPLCLPPHPPYLFPCINHGPCYLHSRKHEGVATTYV